MRVLIVLGAGLALAGCASLARLSEYGETDAYVHVDRAGYAIAVHPTENAILVRERFGGAMGGAFVEGLTLGAVDTSPPLPIPRLAGAAYLAQFGCSAVSAYPIEGTTTEVGFTCPDTVKPRGLDEQICLRGSYASDWRDPDAIELVDCD